MGLFGKKKKKATTGIRFEEAASASGGVDPGMLPAVIGAAVAAYEDAERIAVIGAAIAAYESSDVRTELKIAKIDRKAGLIPAWGVAGNRESIDVRRM
ncbi:MAG: hypothetical protein LBO81_04280 [Clostridiales Family XIII bacterium]|jgi:hypothetical protein|nr:hypothetical protein [Clostridiales Family XIII bacterium]